MLGTGYLGATHAICVAVLGSDVSSSSDCETTVRMSSDRIAASG